MRCWRCGASVAQTVADNSNADESITFPGDKYHPWRRFFARMLDTSIIGSTVLFISASVLISLLSPANAASFLKALDNKIVEWCLLLLLWVPFGAILLSCTGTTPAKWLFGIRILSSDGHKLPLWDALDRTFSVWVQGVGFGIPIVSIFTQLFAYRRLKRTGTTLWDTSVNSNVTHKEWGPVRAITCILCVIAARFFMVYLNSPGNHLQ